MNWQYCESETRKVWVCFFNDYFQFEILVLRTGFRADFIYQRAERNKYETIGTFESLELAQKSCAEFLKNVTLPRAIS